MSKGQVALETKPGRSLYWESPFKSNGELILKGLPELNTMKGLSRNKYGNEMLPPRNSLFLISNEARP